MNKKYFFISLFFLMLSYQLGFSQGKTTVGKAAGTWIALMKGNKFDPNDDQQSVADTDFVGNASNNMVETQKATINFIDGITDETYFFRLRMGQSNASTSFYLGLDVSGD